MLAPIFISINIVAFLFVYNLGVGSDCNQNQLIESLTYSVNAIEYNPRITIVDTPRVKKFSFTPPKEIVQMPPISYIDNHLLFDTSIIRIDTTLLKKGKVVARFKSKEIMDSIKEYYENLNELGDTLESKISEINYTIHSELKIKNVGNALANIISYCSIDTVSGEPILRREYSKLVRGETTDFNFEQGYFDEFFQNELTPNKLITIPLSLKVYKLNKDQQINLHFFIMYENEIGIVYDTYYWIVYENAPMGMEPIYSYDAKENRTSVQFKIHDDVKSRFKVSTVKVSYNIYNSAKSEEIKKWVKNKQPQTKPNNN